MKTISIILLFLAWSTIAYAENQIYAVQVIMARQYENAVYDYEKLKGHRDARIEKINNAYAVRIGAYLTKTDALALLAQLKMTHGDAFLIKYVIDAKRIVQGHYPTGQRRAKATLPIPSSNLAIKHSEIPAQSTTDMPAPIIAKRQEATKPSEVSKPSPEILNKLPEIKKPSPGIEEDFFRIGMQSYHDGQHERTVGALSKYASLAPKSQQRGAALLIIGKSLERMKKPKSALKIYGRIIEQYPDSPEAWFSIVAMADISVANPGIQYAIGNRGAEYVKDPVSAYDTVLSKNVPVPMIEHIQYRKGLALWKLKQYEKAREAQADFLKKFPNTAYRKEVIVMLKDSNSVLINQYSRQGDHVTVAHLFFEGRENGLITSEDVDTLFICASSLSELGLHEDSLNILYTLKRNAIGKAATDIDKALSEVEKKRGGVRMDQPPSETKWAKFKTGREYLYKNNAMMAEQTFAELKNSDSDQFWSKITEYALEENRWTQKQQAPIEK